MKIKTNIITLLAALGFLASCSNDISAPAYTVGEADNAIVLRAGISDGRVGAQTRAGSEGIYVPFSAQTQLRLRMDGTWLGHDPEDVSQMTTAKTAATASEKIDGDSNDKHAVEFTNAEKLYWDDYGTADPANMSTAKGGNVTDGTDGRGKGLTIYGVAVEGKSTLPTTPTDLTNNSISWTDLAWNVGAISSSKISQKGGWGDYDLITSNNIKDGADGTYKFDDFLASTGSNLLKFTHAMTKVTVNLTAGEGFSGYATDPATAKFEQAPEVTLLGFNYTGTVSVEAKTSTPTAATTNIEAWRDKGVAWAVGGQHTSQFTALVFPGNKFADATDILKLEVDGNTLYVNATKINAANNAAEDVFEQGKNYIFNILYNKTGIVVTATVTDWVDVNSEEDKPKININYTYGHEPGTAFEQGFTLYRSTAVDGSYIGTGDKADVSYAASKYTMAPQLYWPTHSTHYFFRGVWPIVDSVDGSSVQLGPTAAQVKANAVDVENVAYKQGYYPSDLMIARPLIEGETATDEACKVHIGTQGICATTGDIRMNFRYMMSQVKVELTTSDPGAADHITFDAKTKVEIIGGYKDGAIKLSDCTSDFAGMSTANYQLHNAAPTDYDSYHDAIIPQNLTEGMKFRITVTNSDSSTDTYETVIKDIKVVEGSNPAALISAWASGKIYTYNLKITKTAIKVTATLTDWIPVTADEDVWF